MSSLPAHKQPRRSPTKLAKHKTTPRTQYSAPKRRIQASFINCLSEKHPQKHPQKKHLKKRAKFLRNKTTKSKTKNLPHRKALKETIETISNRIGPCRRRQGPQKHPTQNTSKNNHEPDHAESETETPKKSISLRRKQEPSSANQKTTRQSIVS